LQSEAESRLSSLTNTEKSHREAVKKLKKTMEQQEERWREKTSEMTAHYSSLLQEAEQRAQRLQQFADEALTKAEEASNARLQFETQLTQLRGVASGYQHDRACLLSSVGLLSGTLFPLLDRLQQLAVQKTLLSSQLANYHSLELMVHGILDSLPKADHHKTTDMRDQPPSSASAPSDPSAILMQFRKVVIVVLAVLHLTALCKKTTHIFSSSSPALATDTTRYCLPVWVGGRHKKKSRTLSSVRPTAQELMSFLHSSRLLKTAREALGEGWTSTQLEATTGTAHLPLTTTHSTTPALHLPLRSGHTSLMKGLSTFFPPLPSCALGPPSPSPHSTGSTTTTSLHLSTRALYYSSDCLARRLAGGLCRGESSYFTPRELSKALHSHVTELLHRVHSAEEAQCTLHSLLQQTRAEYQQQRREQQVQTVHLQQRVECLQAEVY
jgi:hypothetical protein